MTFGAGHKYSGIIFANIVQARLVDLRNKPERRRAYDGTFYTPTVIILQTETGEAINIYQEDIEQVIQTIGGLKIRFTNKSEVQFTWEL